MEKHYLNFKLLTILCFIGIEFSFGQTTLYSDTFTGENGKGQIGTNLDVLGVDWTIDATGGSFADNSDFFAVQSEVFGAQDVDGDVIFTSESFNISGYNNLSFSFDAGASGDFEASSDTFTVEVIIDGGAPQVLFEGIVDESISGDPMFFGSTQLTSTLQIFSSSISGTGNNAIIQITVNNNVGTENYFFDNIEVIGFATGVNTPPSVSNIIQSPFSGIDSSDTVSISADVTDADGTINDVKLSWGTSLGSLNNTINMSNSSLNTNIYKTDTDIPVQNDGTTVYYQIVAVDDDMASTTTTEQSYTVSDAIIIALQDFDGTNPSWTFTNEIPFFDNNWGSDGYYGIIDANLASPLSNSNFSNNILGENDLEDENDNGTSGFANTIFEEISTVNFSNVVLTFDWEVIGYNVNNDDAKYEIFVDGVSTVEEFLVDGGVDSQTDSGTITYQVPDGTSTVSLLISIRNDGGSGYSGFDNIKLEGIFNGNYVYSSGTWKPSPPDSSTGAEDALVANGTYTTSGDVSLNSIRVQKGANVQISPSDVFTIDESISNNGTFTFKSDWDNVNSVTRSAQLADATGATITGDITVERFIPAGENGGRRAYRLLTSAVNSTGSINDNWQEGAVTTAVGNGNPNPGFGTHITGGTVANGFDQNETEAPSMFTFNNEFLPTGSQTQSDGWSQIPNTNLLELEAGKPYLTFIRGDRGIDVTSNSSPPTNTTLRATGELIVGSQTSQVLSNQPEFFSLLGNPYQAIVDFGQITFTGDVNSNILHVWDANASTRGAYVAVTTPSDQMIQPGQSFFVQNSVTVNTAPTVEFTEAAKKTDGSVTTVFSDEQIARANFILYNSDDLKLDVLQLSFEDNANNGLDDFDAGKLGNPDENLSSWSNNALLSVERRATPQNDDLIQLNTVGYRFTNYEFRLNTLNWNPAIDVFVVDNYLNTTTAIDDQNPFNFAVDTNIPESIAENRFSLLFDNTTLGVDENIFGSNFSLYPNPATNGQFSISTPNLSGEVSVEITSLLGQNVYSHNLPVVGNQVDINAQNLSSGIYVVKLTQENQSFSTKLIVE